ncbi:MAG: alpha-L-fucosidase [Phycisphaerae bacterium]|nr:alpha-L-fucosidase [Phycisphaerae bacterium]
MPTLPLLLAALLAVDPAASITPSVAALPHAADASAADASAPISLLPETEEERTERMRWWRESRFGMFIHWGLYAIPAGEWNGKSIPGAAEWILNSAKIKPEEYEPLLGQFNPVKFDAKQWVEIAKNAGMRYIVITSKHHEGFGLWDSALTDWDVASTPFKRDILQELAAACQEAGIRLCFYHSIMDWHHPDYLPRRAWDTRPTAEANFDRYREYMKGQLKELLSGRYGDVGILWFDGEWENTWTHEFGMDLDDWVRSLQKNIIVNNRVDVGREGMMGFTSEARADQIGADRFRGDYGTPEQQIPATGIPGTDWETCMTMNETWGFHKNDHAWKSKETLIRMLVDIASKGGNFLLNVGPTAAGEIPSESGERLRAMGSWMKTNGESIYETGASPFAKLAWGRCTTKSRADGTRLYLHVFDWPADGTLVVPGLLNAVRRATILGDTSAAALTTTTSDGNVKISVPAQALDPIATVIALDIEGAPQIIKPVELRPARTEFVDAVQVTAAPSAEGVVIRYTTDQSEPTAESPELKAIAVRRSTTVKARAFLGDQPIGELAEKRYEFAVAWSGWKRDRQGNDAALRWIALDGEFKSAAEFRDALPPLDEWSTDPPQGLALPADKEDRFGVAFRGLLMVPFEGMWSFRLGSDDGSLLFIDEKLVVDNDGLHSYTEVEGDAPLARGLHLIQIYYFENEGQQDFTVRWNGPGVKWESLTPASFVIRR